MEEFKNIDDFIWYTRKLDALAKHAHGHYGKPVKYPCRLLNSEFSDNPNGPYEYTHTFVYQQKHVCECCGHVTLIWPEVDND